jgi:dolichyl-phosphate-mannose-protein mannosyltransferase
MTRMPAWRRLLPAIGLLAAGLAFRLAIAYVARGQGAQDDLATFVSWAGTLATSGPGTFYAQADSANYPPGYMYVLWLVGVLGNGAALVKTTAILADVGIAALLFVAGRRWLGERVGLAAAALYLFVPVTWSDSAIWGQVDAVGALAMLGAILLLVEGWSEPAAAVAGLAIITKPQDLVVLVAVVPVLVRRHLLAVGRGAVAPRGLERLGPGPIRLVTSAAAFLAVVVVGVLPFDVTRFAPESVAGIPGLAQLAGLAGLVGSDAGHYPVITVYAFNLWALVGHPSVATVISTSSGEMGWTSDTIPLVAGIPAFTIGTALLVACGLVVAAGLLFRDDRQAILLGFALAAFAFYALPTRVHERYLLPFFAPAALLAAPSLRWAAGYVALACLNALNLHALLHPGGFAPPAGPLLAWVPNLFTNTPAVVLIVIGQAVGFAIVLVAWLALLRRGARAPGGAPGAPASRET